MSENKNINTAAPIPPDPVKFSRQTGSTLDSSSGEAEDRLGSTPSGGGKAAGKSFISEIIECYNWIREFGNDKTIKLIRERLGYIITKHHASDLHRTEDGGLEYYKP